MTDLRDTLVELLGDIDVIAVFSPTTSEFDRFSDLEEKVIVIGAENAVDASNFIELPIEFDGVTDRIRYGLEGAMQKGYIEDGDELACVTRVCSETLDSIITTKASESLHSGIYDLFVNSRAEAPVIRDVLELVMQLGKKGQKGEPVGALFVVGDAGKVMNKSRPLSYNPFEKSHVNVGDSIVNVMLKEFSRLDGAFVISDSGKIVSAYRYLEPSAEGVDIPKGLGTRHMAAAAISRDTNAVAIVLSESDGLIRAFKGGELVLEIDPEAY